MIKADKTFEVKEFGVEERDKVSTKEKPTSLMKKASMEDKNGFRYMVLQFTNGSKVYSRIGKAIPARDEDIENFDASKHDSKFALMSFDDIKAKAISLMNELHPYLDYLHGCPYEGNEDYRSRVLLEIMSYCNDYISGQVVR